MAVVTFETGEWIPGKFPRDWGDGTNPDWAHVCPLEYGQETLFREYAKGCPIAFKPHAGATHSASVRYMCRAALVPDWERVAFEIHRFARSWSPKLKKFYWVDTRGRLVLNDEWIQKWSLYRSDSGTEKSYLDGKEYPHK